MLALSFALALTASPPPDAINAVLGDRSWVEAHGARPADAPSEARIATHLAYVERLLRAAPIDRLGPSQRSRRRALLDVLADYRARGVFPRRTDDTYVGRRPRFIDDRGVHCAVGHLVTASGHAALAAEIDARYEYAYVAEMEAPALVEWASEHGFTLDELAMIQPGYSAVPTAESTRAALFSSADAITLACAAKFRPPSHVTVQVRGMPDGSAYVGTESFDPFALCFVEHATKIERGGGAYDDEIQTYAFDTRIPIRSPQRILDERVARIRLGSHDTSCTPSPGPLAASARFEIRVGDEGVRATVTTTPSNPVVAKCLERYLQRALASFGPGAWRLRATGERAIAPRVSPRRFAQEVENEAKHVATDCTDASEPFSVRIDVEASATRNAFEIEIHSEDVAFVKCLRAELEGRLRHRATVYRATPDGKSERYFRIDADAKASVTVEVEPKAARDARVKALRERLERESRDML